MYESPPLAESPLTPIRVFRTEVQARAVGPTEGSCLRWDHSLRILLGYRRAALEADELVQVHIAVGVVAGDPLRRFYCCDAHVILLFMPRVRNGTVGPALPQRQFIPVRMPCSRFFVRSPRVSRLR